MEEEVHTSAELRTYLRQRRNGRNKARVPTFEDFLKDASSIFALRMSAEEYWAGSPRGSAFNHKEHKYQANNAREAVPLEWRDIKKVLLPKKNEPPVTLITYIATHCIEEVRIISSGMRRILSRERVSTPVGKVQQLDTYCMRWLMRQPGRGFTEKAGTRQRVMAVVRREQFDTLENRVFKDFLIRAENLADSYLNEIRGEFNEHRMYGAVRSFKIACQGALALPEMDLISGLTTLPQPNYVLQQDNRYSMIWSAYCKIVHFANLAEKLWGRKNDLKRKLSVLTNECKWQSEHENKAKFHSQVWFEKLDNEFDFTEHTCSDHAGCTEYDLKIREVEKRLIAPERGVAVVDFSGSHTFGPELIIGGYHPNARSRIYSELYPLLDDELALRNKKAEKIPLSFIFSTINDEKLQDERGDKYDSAIRHACDYCARLHGELRNLDRSLDELVVLSPDDWNAVAQEVVIKSFPMFERRKVHLLWRSVATALGMNDDIVPWIKENESISIIDFRNDNKILVTGLKYLKDEKSGRLIPQRSVYLKNGKINAERYHLRLNALDRYALIMESDPVRESRILCLSGKVPPPFKDYLEHSYAYSKDTSTSQLHHGRAKCGKLSWIIFEDGIDSWSQREGALLFAREHDLCTLYFDELEAMWVIGQDEIHEKVVCEDLVKADPRFRGGTSRKFSISAGRFHIGEGQRGVEFLFHMGDITDITPLHQYKQDFVDYFVQSRVEMTMEIEVSPGQGMAITSVNAPIFKEPIILDYLNNMKLSQETIAKKNDELERSFPPTSAIVEAMQDSWGGRNTEVEAQIKSFLADRLNFSQMPPDLFYRVRKKTVKDIRPGESKLHLLDRYNIFGNVKGAMRPSWMSEDDEERLIAKINDGSKMNPSNAIRLLAWTYRGSNKFIQQITRQVFNYWLGGRSPGNAGGMKVWRSLMANVLPCKELRDLLPAFIKEFTKRAVACSLNGDDLRLFYNLIQFDEEFCVHARLTCDEGSSIALALCNLLTQYREGQNTNNYDSALRSLLYLLRLREKERCFLRDYDKFPGEVSVQESTYERMCKTFLRLNKELQLHLYNERVTTRMLRLITLKFLNGSGTLPDLLSIWSDDNG